MWRHWEILPPKSMLNQCYIKECVTCVCYGYEREWTFQTSWTQRYSWRTGVAHDSLYKCCYQSRFSGLLINSTSKAEKSILHLLRSIPGKVPVKAMCLLLSCTKRLADFWGDLRESGISVSFQFISEHRTFKSHTVKLRVMLYLNALGTRCKDKWSCSSGSISVCLFLLLPLVWWNKHQTITRYLPAVQMRVAAHGNRTLSNYFLLALEWEHFYFLFFCNLKRAHLCDVRIPNNAVSRLAEMVAMTMLANSFVFCRSGHSLVLSVRS